MQSLIFRSLACGSTLNDIHLANAKMHHREAPPRTPPNRLFNVEPKARLRNNRLRYPHFNPPARQSLAGTAFQAGAWNELGASLIVTGPLQLAILNLATISTKTIGNSFPRFRFYARQPRE